MWDDTIVTMIRNVIDDTDTESPTYSDDRLRELILTAATLLRLDIKTPVNYRVDIDSQILSPDPTKEATRDDSYVALLVLKSACILAKAEAKTSAGQGIAIKDGSSSIDLKGVAGGKQQTAKTFCEEYQDAKFQYQSGANVSIRAILSPYRVYGAYTTYGDISCR